MAKSMVSALFGGSSVGRSVVDSVDRFDTSQIVNQRIFLSRLQVKLIRSCGVLKTSFSAMAINFSFWYCNHCHYQQIQSGIARKQS